ncbi:MAG: phytoene/squalene synthase family protein [Bauldia sp.]|uniref:phytoene/squalene synthase family protein n=1 Tax=Bauldia sp. TaxID=2575872 RepID=UPI001DFE650E|nr:phytoene/squalene synthase family protein [Bauldia sp.]MCB1495346.1 phytoene/squalene synthase family protein [Bauldia sp.]
MDVSAHCAAIVRAGDRDLYLSDLLAPQGIRAELFALHAFAVEVASLRDKVKEPMLGEIRLQWWRDALRGDHGGSPVASTLALAIARRGLPIDAFDNVLQARIFDLYDDPMPSIGDYEGYAGDTASAIIQLGAIILAGGMSAGTATAAGYAGVAQSITRMLADLPGSAARGQCFIPADRLAAAGTSPDDLRTGRTTAGLRAVVQELVAVARERLTQSRDSLAGVDKAVLPAFLPIAVLESDLKAVSSPARDPLRDVVTLSPLRRQWMIWRAARRGRP